MNISHPMGHLQSHSDFDHYSPSRFSCVSCKPSRIRYDIDTNQALEWATKSGFKGSQNAGILRELITETYINDRTSEPLESHQRYTRIIRDAFRTLKIPYFDAIPSITTLTYVELKRIAEDHARDNLENDIQTPFYFAHYAVRHGLTKSLSKEDAINIQSHSTGETALPLACRLWD